MKRIFCVWLVIYWISPTVQAQVYAVHAIPDSLKANANAVKRMEEIIVDVKSPGKAIISHRYAITVLNESGAEFARHTSGYDPMYSLQKVSGRLYDATGREIKEVKEKDFEDKSNQNGMNLISDDRFKTYVFYSSNYPYTVEFEEYYTLDRLFRLPSWYPLDDEKISVQSSKFEVRYPENYKLRYKQFGMNELPRFWVENGSHVYTWQLNNQKAIIYEPLMTDPHEMLPTVFIAPSTFEMGKYKGDMSTWEGAGLFVKSLMKEETFYLKRQERQFIF